MKQFYEAWLHRKHKLVHVTENTKQTLCGINITENGRWYFDSKPIVTEISCKKCKKLFEMAAL